MVRDHRLVTLTGMGGVGKTRLAWEIMQRLRRDRDAFDNALIVDLTHATENSEQSVVTKIAAALGGPLRDHEDEIVRALTGSAILLVLDGFDTVLSGAAVVDRLIRSCPGLHLLATSRRPLDIDGEQCHEVQAMETPEAAFLAGTASLDKFDSFQLFSARAHGANVEAAAGDHAGADPKLVEVLQMTAGIPLAIELVAARSRESPLFEIASALDKKRVEVWGREGAEADQAHASLVACFEWTMALLPAAARELLPRLSVFAGEFFADAAEAVCEVANVSDHLRLLVQYSLLTQEELLRQNRYRMLETIRLLAADMLDRIAEEADRLKRLHAAHFLRVLWSAGNQVAGKEHFAGLARIGADLDNIFTGIENSRSLQDHRPVVDYSSEFAFTRYLPMTGRVAENLALAMKGRAAAAALADAGLIAACDNNLGNAYTDLPVDEHGENLRLAIECFESVLRFYTERDFPQDWARAQNNLGVAYRTLPGGDRTENINRAIACFEAALRFRTERDFPLGWAETQHNLGNAYVNLPTGARRANLERAIACYEAALRGYTAAEATKGIQRINEVLKEVREQLSGSS